MRPAAFVLVAFACGGGPGEETAAVGDVGAPVRYGEPFDLKLGERAVVAGEFRVTFERIAEESRCPEGSRCPAEGNAAAAFAVESDAGSATLTLNTGREPRSAAAMGGELRLLGLAPGSRPDSAADSVRYEATLIVSPAR
ncbi:MAG TPA: hypothetical protein VJ788_02430 [Gemmatimonadota bacterium]|nr:hypothetical protein [Gemmatimonadota bacterium]